MMAYSYKLIKAYVNNLADGEKYISGLVFKIICEDSRGIAEYTGRTDFSPISAKARKPDPRHNIVAPLFDENPPQTYFDELIEEMFSSDEKQAALAVMFDREFNKENEDMIAEGNRIRDTRNELLTASDWSQLPDVPDTVKQAYLEYRQLLRDLPSQEDFPTNVEWPTEPQV